jgi:hypothetical protein
MNEGVYEMIVKIISVPKLKFKFSFLCFLDMPDPSTFTFYNQSTAAPLSPNMKEGEVECFLVASALKFEELEGGKSKATFFSEILWNYGVSDKKLQKFYSSYYFNLLNAVQK